jgi:hypothetical protein
MFYCNDIISAFVNCLKAFLFTGDCIFTYFAFQLIDKAREYLGLSDLEKRTVAGGILNVCIGDAFSQSVNVSGGYAGEILVCIAFCITYFTSCSF